MNKKAEMALPAIGADVWVRGVDEEGKVVEGAVLPAKVIEVADVAEQRLNLGVFGVTYFHLPAVPPIGSDAQEAHKWELPPK